jgi:hypothetical protein
MCSAIPRRMRVHRLEAVARLGLRHCGLRRGSGWRRSGSGRRRSRSRLGGGWLGWCRGCGRRRRGCGSCAGCARAGLDEREDVLLRHAAAAAGARDLAHVDAVLRGDSRDDRRDERLLARAVAVGTERARGPGCGAAPARRLASGSTAPRLARRPRSRSGGASRRPRRGLGARRRSAGAAPSGAITASFVPTSTVSPSCTRICWTTPEPGSAPRCRPCRSRSRAATRRPRPLAFLLEPLRDRPLGDGDAHLRHDDVDRGRWPPS